MNVRRARLAVVFLCAAAVLGACAGAKPVPQRAPDAPYIRTRADVVARMLELAAVGPGDKVYDLGCGDGRIVIAAARDFGATGVGIDLDPALIGVATSNARDAGVADRVVFRHGDLFLEDFSDATVVTVYLGAKVNLRLKPKLLRELKPGTRVVSHQFDMGPDWPPERQLQVGKSTLYLWTIR
jgi:ubiquinone/menaquinone biosynthesis C-methylase UbiE